MYKRQVDKCRLRERIYTLTGEELRKLDDCLVVSFGMTRQAEMCIRDRYANGAIAGEIAQKIGVSRTTVYTEWKRGQDGVTLDKNFRPAYDPELAQKRVQEGLRRRGRKKEGNANV